MSNDGSYLRCEAAPARLVGLEGMVGAEQALAVRRVELLGRRVLDLVDVVGEHASLAAAASGHWHAPPARAITAARQALYSGVA